MPVPEGNGLGKARLGLVVDADEHDVRDDGSRVPRSQQAHLLVEGEAVSIGERRFVHAPGAGKPVTVNSLDDEFYEKNFESAGRFWEQEPR